ncbi:hypothetical protein CENSYa_0603 [Cenarchaeum symbiosum A]|uniref:Uncharacterized protein n=1 Tax=Cenarchaeum symbiosum (strain A) TaxID=414004 RepID=A0RV69_CENSY|nr:hypothetical protein CENSYa_0603 [Cenarchaeum symbiosum A]
MGDSGLTGKRRGMVRFFKDKKTRLLYLALPTFGLSLQIAPYPPEVTSLPLALPFGYIPLNPVAFTAILGFAAAPLIGHGAAMFVLLAFIGAATWLGVAHGMVLLAGLLPRAVRGTAGLLRGEVPELHMTRRTAAALIVIALIILSPVMVWGVLMYDFHMRSLWPFQNGTRHGSIEDNMGEIRGLPEVEAFHEVYAGRNITFSDQSMSSVRFDYTVRDDGRSASLVIGYYDREPSRFYHSCYNTDLRYELFREDGVQTDCFSFVDEHGPPETD